MKMIERKPENRVCICKSDVERHIKGDRIKQEVRVCGKLRDRKGKDKN